jgi:hypothetical protein
VWEVEIGRIVVEGQPRQKDPFSTSKLDVLKNSIIPAMLEA